MEKDLTMETNHWIVEDPAWAGYSKCVCTKEHHWTGYCGDDFFLKTSKTGRFWVRWPNIAEHFYALQWQARAFRYDTVFASYSLSEIQRFIDAMTVNWPYSSKRMLRVVDEVTKENIPITKFIGIMH